MFWFVSMDVMSKYMMQSYPVVQVMWARFFFHLCWVMVFMTIAGQIKIRSNRPHLQVIRSVLLLGVTFFFFQGINTVQIATASVIMFLAPILVVVLAIPILKEKVGIRRGISVLVGFVGALVVVRPGMIGFEPGMTFLLVAAFCHAFYLLATREVRDIDGPLVSLFYTGAFGAVVTSTIVPFYWVWPAATDWLLFVGIGFFGSVSHLCLIRAFSAAPASVVAPFTYSALLWSTSLGYLVFGDLPDRWVMLGAVLIVASGLYIFFREEALARQEESSG